MNFPRFFQRVFLTWLGCGLSRIAPGTVGSLGALPLCWWLGTHADLPFRLVFAIGFTAVAVLAAAQDQRDGGPKDPQYIVADEVAGMLWATLLVRAAPLPYVAAFVLFRILDIVKPFPASWFDGRSKSSQNALARGAHIVLDDVVSGAYVLLALAGAAHLRWI